MAETGSNADSIKFDRSRGTEQRSPRQIEFETETPLACLGQRSRGGPYERSSAPVLPLERKGRLELVITLPLEPLLLANFSVHQGGDMLDSKTSRHTGVDGQVSLLPRGTSNEETSVKDLSRSPSAHNP